MTTMFIIGLLITIAAISFIVSNLIVLLNDYHIIKLFLLDISDEHLFYKYDLTIYLLGFTILIMWKLTEKGKTMRNNYLSFSVFSRSFNRLIYKRF